MANEALQSLNNPAPQQPGVNVPLPEAQNAPAVPEAPSAPPADQPLVQNAPLGEGSAPQAANLPDQGEAPAAPEAEAEQPAGVPGAAA